MTTQEVADRYHELARRGEIRTIQDELYAPDAVSIEPENDSRMPLRVKGLEALRQKEQQYYQDMVEEMHGGASEEPIVSPAHFACVQSMDVTLKGRGRTYKVQLGVFTVDQGKIVSEQFFYDDFS
jgi:hypothetical protein